MDNWKKIRAMVRSANAAVQSEPHHLAPIVPLMEEATGLLETPVSEASVSELEYLLNQSQQFVAKWRPSSPQGGSFYSQPQWAKACDEYSGKALELIGLLRIEGVPLREDKIKSNEVTQEMKVFISHSSADSGAAEAMVGLIRAALNISANDIRCTSVDGYKLPPGSRLDEQLRKEVFSSEVFVALLSPDSLKSMYVMFELGARWASDKYLAPVRVKTVVPRDIKPPLSALHSISGTSENDVYQLLETLSSHLSLPIEKPMAYSKQLKAFTDASKV